jgi:predicted DsbA family dithiol-disulfide isomerase
MRVEIYSDVVCPWCYIGERRFARALADLPDAGEVEVVYRPFQLDPNAPAAAVPLAEYLEKRFGPRVAGMHGQVDAAGAGEGITFDWDRALAVNTRTAHRLVRLAEREYGAEVQRALVERLFDLHFTRGGDVSDPEQLADEAAAVGMDRARARAHLGSDEGVRELEAEFEAARRIGVRAVPTFVFDGSWAVEGAQPTARFAEALAELSREKAPAGGADGGEACADGACEVRGVGSTTF